MEADPQDAQWQPSWVDDNNQRGGYAAGQ